MQKNLIALLLTVSLVLSACTQNETSEKTSTTNETKQVETSEKEQKRAARTFKVQSINEVNSAKNLQVTKIGTIEAASQIEIKSETSGRIISLAPQGVIIKKDQQIAALGSSLNTDLQEITLQNSINSLKNNEQLLKQRIINNTKALENAVLTIAQAEVQLQTAIKSQENAFMTEQMTLSHLSEQGQSNYFSIIEHLRDTARLARQADNTSQFDYQINQLENEIYQNRYATNPQELDYLLEIAAVILANTKAANDQSYANQSDFVSVNVQDPNSAPSFTQTESTPSVTTAQINQLQAANTQFKQALQTLQQNQEKTSLSTETQITSSQSQIELAQIQLENARQQVELKKLQIELENQQLLDQLDQLAGQVAINQRNLQSRSINAPTQGVLLETKVSIGDQVNQNQIIATIADMSKVKAKISLTQNEATKLRLGQKAQITLENGTMETGEITLLPLIFDQQTKTGITEITLNNTKGLFLPGMTVEISLYDDKETATNPSINNSIQIPLNSVYFDSKNYVFIKEQSKAKKVNIETGKISGNMIEVKSGIKTGDEVILEKNGITEGMEIK
jgi:multidrug efflux pump subunit AcrA (membrane-fusion protein)